MACPVSIAMKSILKTTTLPSNKKGVKVRFGEAEALPYSSLYVISGRTLWLKPSRARKPNYKHTNTIDTHSAEQQAQVRAMALEESVKIDLGDPEAPPSPYDDKDAPISWRRRVVKNIVPRTGAAAKNH